MCFGRSGVDGLMNCLGTLSEARSAQQGRTRPPTGGMPLATLWTGASADGQTCDAPHAGAGAPDPVAGLRKPPLPITPPMCKKPAMIEEGTRMLVAGDLFVWVGRFGLARVRVRIPAASVGHRYPSRSPLRAHGLLQRRPATAAGRTGWEGIWTIAGLPCRSAHRDPGA